MNNKYQYKSTAIQEYNPLLDRYLTSYFQNKQIINVLHKNRIINRRGEVVNPDLRKQYKRHNSNCRNNTLPLIQIIDQIKVKQTIKSKSRERCITESPCIEPKITKTSELSRHLNNTYLKKPSQFTYRNIRSYSNFK